ncbi:MAG: dual specificity protein phosphatase family protein [Anaerolineae bacterium]|nr:dual specificity protein phosphatase family protein [Anaerolineae bacterium]
MLALVPRALKALRIVTNRLRTQGLRTTLAWLYGRGVPKLTGVPLLRFSQITPQVLVGGQYRGRGKRKLEALGITGVVNLRAESDDAARGLALAEYCYLPTVDDGAPTLEHLAEGAAFIGRVTRNGGKVYIHCAGGVGRAPTMAAAYFITQGMTLDEALALIRRTRPFIRIMPPQIAQLQRFEAQQRQE